MPPFTASNRNSSKISAAVWKKSHSQWRIPLSWRRKRWRRLRKAESQSWMVFQKCDGVGAIVNNMQRLIEALKMRATRPSLIIPTSNLSSTLMLYLVMHTHRPKAWATDKFNWRQPCHRWRHKSGKHCVAAHFVCLLGTRHWIQKWMRKSVASSSRSRNYMHILSLHRIWISNF